MKKAHIGIIVLVLALVVISGIYLRTREDVVVAPTGEEPIREEGGVVGEIPPENNNTKQDSGTKNVPVAVRTVEVASIENLEKDLASDLGDFSNDSGELGGVESDTSLDTIDTGLAGI